VQARGQNCAAGCALIAPWNLRKSQTEGAAASWLSLTHGLAIATNFALGATRISAQQRGSHASPRRDMRRGGPSAFVLKNLQLREVAAAQP
jgi:hypothetical protein